MIQSTARTLGRVVLPAAMAATAILVVKRKAEFRGWEALATGRLVDVLTPMSVDVTRPNAILWTGVGSHMQGLQVTPECSAALLVAGFAIVAGVAIALRGRNLVRLLIAGLGAVGVVFAVNLVRLLVIVLATAHWGERGFSITHVYVGTLLTLGGLVLAVATFIMLATGGRSGAPRRVAARWSRS